MKPPVLVAVADACNVTIEWLAAGRGPMRPGEAPPSQSKAALPELFETLNMDIMAIAIQSAYDAYGRRGGPIPWRNVARLAALSYNEIVDAEAKEAAAKLLTVKPTLPIER